MLTTAYLFDIVGYGPWTSIKRGKTIPIIPFGDVSQAISGDSKRAGTETRYAAFWYAREISGRPGHVP